MSNNVICVAYADDDTAVRESIADNISLSGKIRVGIRAANGTELIKKLEEAERLPDVCILDIEMPGKKGFDTQKELLERWPDLKILVFTVHEQEFHVRKMISGGARGYLLKRCTISEIEHAISEIHTYGTYHSEITTKEITLPKLNEKEITVLRYCCKDLSYAEIALILKTTRRGVEGYRDSLFKKLNVNSRIALMIYAMRTGIVTIEEISSN